MNELEKIAKKLENGGFGTKINGDRLTVYESWEPECVRILEAKTYKEALRLRNNGIEVNYNLVCISCRMIPSRNGEPKISTSVFRMLKEHQVINKGDYVKVISSTNPYVPSGSIMKIESVTTVVNGNGEVQVFNASYKGHPYSVHRRTIELFNYVEPEKVNFT